MESSEGDPVKGWENLHGDSSEFNDWVNYMNLIKTELDKRGM